MRCMVCLFEIEPDDNAVSFGRPICVRCINSWFETPRAPVPRELEQQVSAVLRGIPSWLSG